MGVSHSLANLGLDGCDPLPAPLIERAVARIFLFSFCNNTKPYLSLPGQSGGLVTWETTSFRFSNTLFAAAEHAINGTKARSLQLAPWMGRLNLLLV